ncbi:MULTISPECIES: type II secretion system protein [unclassified Campylobacter]|uniref:type II secretion system protein n=1 Tax=unclassified Campylobacter TaxID=2593542 RepID=UPI001237C3AF|nr:MULTISPECIES: type II secretion system protein [unclassified Campylobacter]KAA6225258.1 type II secretion system protein [Campylobacter sp. LR185c]KAA6227674.1 type II secretion system protein [Campylobacter sp. LR286c]KAA6233614.1 type II secretion system protein [Campylobacter sp. LR291e]KAA8603283.1 hypothetical protein CGP82_08085 [Campylobacter sp. LR185c]
MKQAFSLVENILVIVLLGIIFAVIFKPLQESYRLNFTHLKEDSLTIDINLALLFMDKILSNCIDINIENNGFNCLLKDSENLLNLENKKLSLLNSSLLLKINSHFYIPNAKLSQILENRKKLFNDSNQRIFALNDDKLITLQVINDNNVSVSSDFNGFFTPILAKINFSLENDDLIYNIYPNITDESLKQSAILAKNISEFKLSYNTNFYSLKLCVKDFCLEKLAL